MKKSFFTILFILFFISCIAQKKGDQIEINPYYKLDWYPEFSYSINPSNNYFAKISATSWGINANYKFDLGKKIFLKFGTGYFKYAFNKIEGKNSLFPSSKFKSRVIAFPSPLYVIFGTDKYWYNTISINIGIEKVFDISRSWKMATGLLLNNYYTFSQTYHMKPDYPIGPPNHKYKLKNNRYFGLSSSVEIGLLKKIKQINIGPVLLLPVYDMWKQDKVFPKNENSAESDSDGRHKWFRGIGFGISCSYSITKK
jgi:hypothetical protein